MDDFFSHTSRDLKEANLVVQDCSNSIAALREKCCDLELSLTALHDPDWKVKLHNVKNLLNIVSQQTKGQSDMKVTMEVSFTNNTCQQFQLAHSGTD